MFMWMSAHIFQTIWMIVAASSRTKIVWIFLVIGISKDEMFYFWGGILIFGEKKMVNQSAVKLTFQKTVFRMFKMQMDRILSLEKCN